MSSNAVRVMASSSEQVAPSTSHTTATALAPVQLRLSAVPYAIVWWSLVNVYLFVTLFLLVQVVFYVVSATWPKAGYFAETYQLLPLSGFRVAAVVYGYLVFCIVIPHLLDLVRWSIQARRLCISKTELSPPPNNVASSLPTSRETATSSTLQSATTATRPFSFNAEYFQYARDRLESYVGVCGQGYEVGKLARDSLQIVSLSIQAYDSSRYTPNMLLNVTYVVLIAVTCLSGPVIHLLRLRSLALERLATLVVDLLVDATYLVLPLVLFLPYIQVYMGDESIMFQDSYGAQALMELRILFVASYFNLAVKLVPIVGVLTNTAKIRELVRWSLPMPDTKVQTHKITSSESSIITTQKRPGRFRAVSVSVRAFATSPRPRSRKIRAAQRLLSLLTITWGTIATVAFISTTQSMTECPAGCLVVLHPWFVTSHCRCAVQLIDCHTRQIQGRAEELRSIFASLQRPGLATLIILHCPALEIPQEVHWFRDLYQFEIYNSSIVSWPTSAALSRRVFSRLGLVYLVRTDITEIPEALLASELPKSLKEIGIVVSRLSSLPDDLDTKWPRVRTLALDHGQFQIFPRVLGRMKLNSLSLFNNSITSIPDDAFVDSAFNYLLLNGNPLTAIPAMLGSTLQLYEVQIQNTNISSLALAWSQVLFARTTTIYARGAPICGDNSRDVETEEGAVVLCSPRNSRYGDEYSLSYYTLEGKTEERRIAN